MKNGIIVYNIVNENNLDWMIQVDRFVDSFATIGIKLIKITNARALSYIKEKKDEIGFVLFWDKDAYLAEAIESLKIKMFNSPKAIRVCDDKALTYVALTKADVITPKTLILPFIFSQNVLNYYELIKNMIGEVKISYPFIVKERFGSYGEQVYLVNSEAEFIGLLKQIGDKPLLVQEYLSFSYGKDYRVNVVGDKIVSIVLRTNLQNFRSNVHQGGKMEAVKGISKEVKQAALRASKACHCDFSGVDIIIDPNGKPYVLEVNSNARTVAVEKYSNIPITEQIAKYIAKNL